MPVTNSATTMPITMPMLIDGRPVLSDGQHLEVINPATEEVIAHVPDATDAQLDLAVSSAQEAFASWRRVSPEDRRETVRRIGAILLENVEELATLLTTEQGKPLAMARAEVNRAATWCAALADLDVPWCETTETATHTVHSRRVPMGVVAAIAPWNFPVTLAVWKIAPALLAGNTVVVKPSPLTPLTGLRLGQLIAEVVPPGAVNVISGGDSLGPRLTGHPGISKIAFTGSTATGKQVMKTASQRLTRVTLELGGNDPAIVLPDADLDDLAPKIFWACFQNSAQYCLAAKRVYIHDSIYDELAAKVRDYAREVRVGNGMEPEVGLGPIQNRQQYDKVRAVIDECRQSGLSFLLEPEIPEGPGYFIGPSIVDNPPEDSPIVTEEPFGPIVPFLRYTDIEDVIKRANDSPYGLGGSVWGGDLAEATRVAERIESGVVWVNEVHRLDPVFPFGGHRESGVACENGVDGILHYTHTNVISIRKA